MTRATSVAIQPVHDTSGAQEDDDGVRSTREMIERAVSLAFTDAAAVGIDQSTFEDPRESMDSVALDASPGKENVCDSLVVRSLQYPSSQLLG